MNDIARNQNGGFTIVEVLVAIGITGFLMGCLFTFSIAQRRHYFVEEQIAEMVQNARAAMDMISGEVVMAGYNPEDIVFSGIPYDSTELQIFADLNGNGVLTDSNENITYKYDSSSKRIVRKTNNGSYQPLVENVQLFNFNYLDTQGNPTTVTANIRQIRITITVHSGKPDMYYTENGGYRSFTLSSVVTPRNLAF
jgi:type IV pilus assembly protein PilW